MRTWPTRSLFLYQAPKLRGMSPDYDHLMTAITVSFLRECLSAYFNKCMWICVG
jgi:hypothetical protein